MIFLYSYPHPSKGIQKKQELPSHSLQNENHNHRNVTKIIKWITALYNSYEPCCVGPPKMDGSWWRVLIKHGPLEKGMANHLVFFASRTPWTVWIGRKIWHQKMSPSDQKVSNMLLGECGETVTKRMKSLGQSRNDAQLWIFHGGESKVWCCKKHYCIGTWNVRSLNKGKLDIIKQDMTRVSTDMVGICEWKCTGIGKFYSDDHYMCYWEGNRQEG